MNLVTQPAGTRLDYTTVAQERIIDALETQLEATLTVPIGATGVVALLHASSAGRFAPRNRFAAQVLEQSGLASLQVDLLTPGEEAAFPSTEPRARTELLLGRVFSVIEWLKNQHETRALLVGLLATSIESQPALLAASGAPDVAAVVAIGGFSNATADDALELRVPTLQILGSREQARSAELAAEFFALHLAAHA